MATKKFKFDFAISFAAPQRDIARYLFNALEKKGFRVFFDENYEHEFLGEDGTKFFRRLYSEETRYCIALISSEYDRPHWTKMERDIIEARELKSGRDILLPVLIGDYRPKWLIPTRIYFNLKKRPIEELIEILEKKIAPSQPRPKVRNKVHQVFISYSNDSSDNATNTRSDRDIADMICSALEAEGIRCWIAHRDILAGEDWVNSIIDAVEHSKIIVLIFSSNSEKSQWVKNEITLALDNNMRIIPFRIEDFPPQGVFKILKLRFLWIDAFTPPLENHVDRLVRDVRAHLEKNEKKSVDE